MRFSNASIYALRVLVHFTKRMQDGYVARP
jgi:hypothetical protein